MCGLFVDFLCDMLLRWAVYIAPRKYLVLWAFSANSNMLCMSLNSFCFRIETVNMFLDDGASIMYEVNSICVEVLPECF